MTAKINDGLTNKQRHYRRKGYVGNAGRVKAWREANPDRALALSRASYARNRPARLAAKKDQWRRIGRIRRKEPAALLADRIRKEARRAKTAGVNATLTKSEWLEICRAQGGQCFYCQTEARLEQDHKVPLSKGGVHSKENVVGACKPCNSSKGARASFPPRLSAR